MPQASATSRPNGADVVDDAQTRADRALGVVLVRARRTEQREDAVAGEILHGAPERLDRHDHASDGIADHELELLGVEPLTEGRRADEVGEEGGDVAAFVPDVHARILRHERPPGNRSGQSVGRSAARTKRSTSRSRRRNDA